MHAEIGILFVEGERSEVQVWVSCKASGLLAEQWDSVPASSVGQVRAAD